MLSNFNPHPPRFCNEIENLIKNNNIFYLLCLTSDKDASKLEIIKSLQCSLNATFENAKNKYYSKLSTKMSHPKNYPKAFKSILKVF